MSLFQFGQFTSHSGLILPWKMDCDALTDEDIGALAQIVARRFAFSEVRGVPRGGLRLAGALLQYARPDSDHPILIVDDVLTTGNSMNEMRGRLEECGASRFLGIVIAARYPAPDWVLSIINVSEWAQ